jgi:hypothetical protein
LMETLARYTRSRSSLAALIVARSAPVFGTHTSQPRRVCSLAVHGGGAGVQSGTARLVCVPATLLVATADE